MKGFEFRVGLLLCERFAERVPAGLINGSRGKLVRPGTAAAVDNGADCKAVLPPVGQAVNRVVGDLDVAMISLLPSSATTHGIFLAPERARTRESPCRLLRGPSGESCTGRSVVAGGRWIARALATIQRRQNERESEFSLDIHHVSALRSRSAVTSTRPGLTLWTPLGRPLFADLGVAVQRAIFEKYVATTSRNGN